MTELSDELLVAYVDGQLERKQSRAVEKVLEQDDEIARRVLALKDAHSRLEAAFEAVLAGEKTIVEPPPEPPDPGMLPRLRLMRTPGNRTDSFAPFAIAVPPMPMKIFLLA